MPKRSAICWFARPAAASSHDLSLAVGESLEKAADFVVVVPHACADLLEAGLDCGDEDVGRNGLLKKVAGALLEGGDRHVDIGMGRHEDDGPAPALVEQLALGLDAVEFGHLIVEDEAARNGRIVLLKELLGRRMNDGPEPLAQQKKADRVCKRFVIVDDSDEHLRFFNHVRLREEGSVVPQGRRKRRETA